MTATVSPFRQPPQLPPIPATMPEEEARRWLAYEAIRLAGNLAREAGLSAVEAMTAIHNATDLDACDPPIGAFYETIGAERAEPPELAARTPRQQAIWRCFRAKWTRHHLAPTLRDLCLHIGISSSSVAQYNCRVLERHGLLEHRPGHVHGAWMLPAKWR